MKTIKNCSALVSVAFFSLFFFIDNTTISAQEVWNFKTVLHESYYDANKRSYYKQPDYIQVNRNGGVATFTAEYTKGCVERYEVKWSFNRDISVLRPGEKFWVNISARNLADCSGTSIYAAANAGSYDAWSPMKNRGAFTAIKDIHGYTKKVFPYPHATNGSVAAGQTQGKFWVNHKIHGNQTYFHLAIRDNGGGYSGQKDRVFYEIVYLYEKGYSNSGSGTVVNRGTTTSSGNGGFTPYSDSPSLAGVWYLNGNRNWKRYIKQSGNYLTFNGGQSSSKGYFTGNKAIYATDWRASAKISSDGQRIEWNNQAWTRYITN